VRSASRSLDALANHKGWDVVCSQKSREVRASHGPQWRDRRVSRREHPVLQGYLPSVLVTNYAAHILQVPVTFSLMLTCSALRRQLLGRGCWRPEKDSATRALAVGHMFLMCVCVCVCVCCVCVWVCFVCTHPSTNPPLPHSPHKHLQVRKRGQDGGGRGGI
jgi:hypothetical protein